MSVQTRTEQRRRSEVRSSSSKLRHLDAGDLARLRRHAGRTLAESTGVLGLFYRLLPYGVPERQHEHYFLVATLFPLTDESQRARLRRDASAGCGTSTTGPAWIGASRRCSTPTSAASVSPAPDGAPDPRQPGRRQLGAAAPRRARLAATPPAGPETLGHVLLPRRPSPSDDDTSERRDRRPSACQE